MNTDRPDRLIEVLKLDDKKWFWRCRASNGRLLYQSPSFNTKYHCAKQAKQQTVLSNRAGVRTGYNIITRRRRK